MVYRIFENSSAYLKVSCNGNLRKNVMDNICISNVVEKKSYESKVQLLKNQKIITTVTHDKITKVMYVFNLVSKIMHNLIL